MIQSTVIGIYPKFRLLVIFLFFSSSIFSQVPGYKQYTTKNGLLSDAVYGLFEDKNGYLYLFSEYGSLKYNGSEFKSVFRNLPFKDSFIYCMYENNEGKKWIANSNGKIYEIRNDSAFIIKGIEKISEYLRRSVSEIVQLCVDDSLNIYALTKGISYKLTRNTTGLYTGVDINANIKPDSVLIRTIQINGHLLYVPMRIDNDEFVFNGVKNRVYLQLPHDGKKFKLNYTKATTGFRHFKKFNEDFYFSYSNYLGKIVGGKDLRYINVGGIVLNYTKDKDNHTWVGCLNDGLYELNEHDSIINHYLSKVTVNDVLVDGEGGLWVSTVGMGLFRFDDFRIKYYEKDSPLGTPLSFLKCIDNQLFISTIKGDIFLLKNDILTKLRTQDNHTPTDMVRVKNNYIVSLNYSIEKLDFNGRKYLSSDTKAGGKQYQLFAKGDDTLISIWRRGIQFSVNGVPKKRIDFGNKILTAQLINNELWFGTEDGVFKYPAYFNKPSSIIDGEVIPDKEKLVNDPELKIIEKSVVNQIIKDNKGVIWFCTMGDGLFKKENSKIVQFNSNPHLPASIINNLSFNGDTMFVCSNKGLFMGEIWKNSSRWEKIYSGEVKSAIVFQGKIYINSNSGLVTIDSEYRVNKRNYSRFNLVSILIDSKETPIPLFNKVDNTQERVEFIFDVISFSGERPATKYFLRGNTIDSGIVKNSVLRFSRLIPGSYTLTAFPTTNSAESVRVLFKVEPKFWQTFIFQTFLIVFFIGFVLLVVWAVLRYYRKKQLTKTKNEQLILEYKLVALKAQINPHFMSNCLSAIQNLIVSNKTEKATAYVAKFGLMVRQILDFSTKSVISLHEELELLMIYLELEQLRFENKFLYSIKIADEINAKDLFVPPLLLNPIVENAIWHGLLPLGTSRTGELSISIEIVGGVLIILISDNGVGRTFKKLEILQKHKSYGIQITEQRLNNINFLYKTEQAKIVFRDELSGGNTPMGTSVALYLPINLNPNTDGDD